LSHIRYPPEWIHDLNSSNPRIEIDFVSSEETWTMMEKLVDDRLCRKIGVSNFNVQNLMNMMGFCRIKPYVNQVEIHPLNSQEALFQFCDQLGIKVTSYSPLGSPSYIVKNMDRNMGSGLLNDALIVGIAFRHGKTCAQVLIRWGVQRGYSVIFKSDRLERIIENTSVIDFELSAEEMEVINNLNQNIRFNDPGEFCKSMGGAIPIFN
jgi:D-xylose reductase